MSETEAVAKLYDASPEREWNRLDERRIEFGVTQRALSDFLPPAPASVIDIGSGPGRYAIPLAIAGYTLSLVDVSSGCLALAKTEAARQGVSLERVEPSSATSLASFADGTFDAALLLGPLYHLKEEGDRVASVKEALRVLRPGGILFSAFLTRYSVVRYAAKTRPDQFTEAPDLIESILAKGTASSDRPDAAFLKHCYFSDPAVIEPFMESCGVQTDMMVGCEGVVAEVEERLNELPDDELDTWVDLNYRLGRKAELIAASAHVLHVGRRPRAPD